MKKRKLKVKKIIILIFMIIILIICIYIFINSMCKIINWKLENDRTKEIQNVIQENITNDEENKNKNSILDVYNIDFSELKKINSEVVGYIKVENTKIDSTVVKHKDNKYYLNHSFDKSWNSAGWIFSHYKNKYDGTDKNYVIFGHSRKDGSMFGTLKNILTKKWLNKESKIIFITENKKSLYEVISVYKIKAEDYYIKTYFPDNKSFENFIKKIKSRSIKDFKTDVSVNDRLLTLSTCDSNNQYRIVLHAKEIKEN